MNAWISQQANRQHADRAAYEAALMTKVHLLDQHLIILHDLFAQKRSKAGSADEMQRHSVWTTDQENTAYCSATTATATTTNSHGAQSGSNGGGIGGGGSSHPEFSYTTIQSTTDAILELAHWICGPDFEMDLGRLSLRWRQHAPSLEQVVHYVQVVESMRETVASGPFHRSDGHHHHHNAMDLAEDLAQCQEVIDYQRTLFGEILRNNGLRWRALGLPAMEPLIESTQLWILHLAKTITAKIQTEVQWAIHAYQQQLEELSNKDGGGGSDVGSSSSSNGGGGGALDLDKCPEMDTKMATGSRSRSMAEVMELVLQGALLANSCLELAGMPCPALVTSWLTLSTPYCWYALTSRQQFIAKLSVQQQNKALMKSSSKGRSGLRVATNPFIDDNVRPSSPSGTLRAEAEPLASARMSRGSFLKTMALFENVSRLLQCLMEMREGEEMLIQEGRPRHGSSLSSPYEGGSGGFGNGTTSHYDSPSASSDSLDELTRVTRGVFGGNMRGGLTEGDSSATSSDQDDAMDGVTTALSSGASSIPGSAAGYVSSSSLLSSTHQHHPSRSPLFSSRRKSPLSSMTQMTLERLKATEELAAILVEAGLELCSSMAEALGQGWSSSRAALTATSTVSSLPPSSSSLSTSAMRSTSSLTPAAIGKSVLFRTGDASNPFAYEASIHRMSSPSPPLLVLPPTTLAAYHGMNAMPATASAQQHHQHHQHHQQQQQQQQQRNRSAVAVATLTALGGGGALVSGSGGIGLIYVQFVVRFLTKVIEFSGVDSAQDQRLVRIHASLQNLEATLSVS
ncbi:hypothetical protein DFQ26_004337 [Actinomortierella ambigua]|nr:hypothetical protein DFQ26_004326 [Actinomortierella ambigua]KAF9161677.1 hypothetical protein DFQ26_004337 [Actinomortierella ambigua]